MSELNTRVDNLSPLGYKHIGRYYRQLPGSPEYIGLRVKPAWLNEEKYTLLVKFLKENQDMANALRRERDNDLEYAEGFLAARKCLQQEDLDKMNWSSTFKDLLVSEKVEFTGMWDDHVERLEFYRERTSFLLLR